MKRRKVNKIKIFCLIIVFLLANSKMAAIVSDNDGSAFITKAEFDSLKSNFQSVINNYNTSIDSKIDQAIADYLMGNILSATKLQLLTSNVLRYKFYKIVPRIAWKSGGVMKIAGGLQARYFDQNVDAGIERINYYTDLEKKADASGGKAETCQIGVNGQETDKLFWVGKYNNITVKSEYEMSGAYCWSTGSTKWNTNGTGMYSFTLNKNPNTMVSWGNYSDSSKWFTTKGYNSWSGGSYANFYTYLNRDDSISYDGFDDSGSYNLYQQNCISENMDYVLYRNPEVGTSYKTISLTDKFTYQSSDSTRGELPLYYNSTFIYYEQAKYSTEVTNLYSYTLYNDSKIPVRLYEGIPLFNSGAGKISFSIRLASDVSNTGNIEFYLKSGKFNNVSPNTDNVLKMSVIKVTSGGNIKIGDGLSCVTGKQGEEYQIELEVTDSESIYCKMTGESDSSPVWIDYISDIKYEV